MKNDVGYPARRVDWKKRSAVEGVLNLINRGVAPNDVVFCLSELGVSEKRASELIIDNEKKDD